MLALLTGFAAGAMHVVSGPDHLAALAPLALERRLSALRVGAAWGLGHGVGVVGLGALAMLARGAMEPERVSGVAELVVGGTLVLLGARALLRAAGLVVHTHEHELDHAHPHVHFRAEEHGASHAGHSHAALGVGVLHGAAGASHLFGVLPALALSSFDAGTYLVAYLTAAVCTMTGFGLLLGRLGRGGPRVTRRLLSASGATAMAVGLAWIGASWSAL